MEFGGNAAYLGETIDLKKMNADVTAYTEWAVGYARKLFDDQLRVGIAVKYLTVSPMYQQKIKYFLFTRIQTITT